MRFLLFVISLAISAFATLLAMHRSPAWALPVDPDLECHFAISDIDFGDINVLGYSTPTTGTLSIECKKGKANSWVTICPNLEYGSGNPNAWDPRQMANTSDFNHKLNYQLYHHGEAKIWGSYYWAHPPRPPVLRFRLNGAGAGSWNVTIDARLFSGQVSVVPGHYVSTFAGNDVRIAYKAGRSSNCLFPLDVESPPFHVRANVIEFCQVVATDLDFGIAGVLDNNIDATGIVRVRCTNGTNYRVGLNGGLAGATSPDQRRMSNGPNSIRYGIYRNAARTLGWGDQIGNSVSGTGNGNFQSYTTYGRVFPQPAPPPGVYTDTIVVTVTY